MFVDFDLSWDVAAEQLGADGQSLLGAERDVVARENAFGANDLLEDVDDDAAKRLEAGAHELDDEPVDRSDRR